MRKVLPALLILLAPSILFAQAELRVSAVYGHVEFRATTSKAFQPLSASTQTVQVGDGLRTGPGGTVTLHLPDC